MYQPAAFRMDDRDRLHALIRDNALALLVTTLDDGLEASHVPVMLDTSSGEACLLFHLARANPLATALDGEREVLFVFQGPEAYVSPDWYRSDGMVPTWNYAVVHACGVPTPVDDAGLVSILAKLSAEQEGRLDKQPWTADKLDGDAYARMRRAIVGFAMPVRRLHGKWKMGQNRRLDDRQGVIDALTGIGYGRAAHTARTMSELIAGTPEGDER